ncbi:site-specific DNA-methyltransferase (adenine-specific) [Pedobacter westerhofensis]|uniref:site-specific DNA-methyltransferase (adenine-specific) n=1 Tax=Pedobacter westerhofensis TaxID=425512 RepID=A0A521FUS8_9SPHI|nr:DNA methyltransferase [Pedobacter westerhofensis]SMO99949.1 site-specific DNA-methyltransferase (adenine-specific) [Pedobacter westerhofensis]
MISEVQLLDRIAFLDQFPDKYFDWAIDDPPYFSGPERRGFYGRDESTTKVKRVHYEKTPEWVVPGKDYFDLLISKSKNQIIWGVNYYSYIFQPGRIVWDKVNSNSTFSDCEIAYCSSHDSTRLFRYMWNGMLQGLNIKEGHIQIGNKKLNEKRIHPTQKPVNLYKWLYLNYAKPGQRIVDCHVGSGSHRIAAHEYGCDFYGCELSPVHFAGQQQRFEEFLKQQMLFTPSQMSLLR